MDKRQEIPRPIPSDNTSRRLRFESEGAESASPPNNGISAANQNIPKRGFRQKKNKGMARPSERLRPDGAPSIRANAVKGKKQTGRPKFRMEKTSDKLEKAKEKLAAQKPFKKPGMPKSAVRGARTEAWRFVHNKVYQAEEENAGIKAAHRTELAGESLVHGGARIVKRRVRTRPARRVRKWDKRDMKAKAEYNYRFMTQEQPELRKNAVSRYLQKRRIKKQYQKQAREAAKKAAKKTAETTVNAAKAIVAAGGRFVTRHPIISLIILVCVLIVVTLQSCIGGMVGVGSGITGSLSAAVYPSVDEDMLAAEAAYADMEASLQYQLDNYPRLHPGYDEYRYDLDAIWHDPYVLISILTAIHGGAWTLDQVQGIMTALFTMQYTLTETVTVETRYRWEISSYTDPETGETTYEYILVRYDYYICTITLDNFNLSHLPIYIMSEEQLSRYAMYMATLGCRPDLFPANLYPHASVYKEYERYHIPPEYLADQTFAAIIKEAEKYLGYPYVWGGYCPATSFDCSGFVSWVINHSGWNVGRLTAQGLYNICTPVSATNAKPGDLVFFIGTYDTPEISHVGIYVGDGMMIHCGNPISYISINNSYYTQHLYSYGKLP